MRRELPRHPRGIEAKLSGVLDQVVVLERELPLKQAIVHHPELALRPRRLRHFGGVLGMHVHLLEGKVAEHEP